jgi:hypothetical protein
MVHGTGSRYQDAPASLLEQSNFQGAHDTGSLRACSLSLSLRRPRLSVLPRRLTSGGLSGSAQCRPVRSVRSAERCHSGAGTGVDSTGRRCYEPVCLDFPALWGDCSRVARPGVAGLLKPPALSGRETADTETDSAPEREDSEVPRRRARMSHLPAGASDEFSRRRRPGE